MRQAHARACPAAERVEKGGDVLEAADDIVAALPSVSDGSQLARFLGELARLVQKKREKPKAALRTILSDYLPVRLAQALANRLAENGADIEEMGRATDKSLREIEGFLRTWTLEPTGTEGYAKAEVTAGGISTNELSSRTMESKTVPGLYFIGECVDVTGWLGGYNFQWAWASGVAAAQAI